MLIEFDMDASGPFLLPRVRECFDFHSTTAHCHDVLCSEAEAYRTAMSETRQGSIQDLSDGADVVEDVEATKADTGNKSLLGGFRFGLPEKQLRSAMGQENTVAPIFYHRVERCLLVYFENFYFQRNILNVVALEGPPRFIRPRSQQHWIHHLSNMDFKIAPITQQVQEQVYLLAQTFPSSVSVNISRSAMAMTLCGRPIASVSLWTS